MKIKLIFVLMATMVVFIAGFGLGLKKERETLHQIAVVYIATGRYIDFWDTFYASAEKNFVPEMPKHYFVFTDDTTRTFPPNVTRIYQKQLEWPMIALLRYHLVDSIKDRLERYDYAFFFNANAVIVRRLGLEFLPDKEQKLVAAKHPYFYNQPVETFPYEERSESKAFIPHEKRQFYFQSGLSSGQTTAYLAMNALLKKRVQADLDNDIIAVWHDESHYNWFMAHYNPVILEPNYIFGTNLPVKTVKKFAPDLKIIMLNKATDLFGGHSCMRGQTQCSRPYQYSAVASGRLIYVIHPHWMDWLEFKNDNKICYFNSKKCAPVTRQKNGIKIHWTSGVETFRQTQADFVYVWDEPHV